MRIAAFAAAGAVALLSTVPQSRAVAQTGGAPAGWWYAGQAGQTPQRQLIFVDRSTVRSAGGNASGRAMAVFEQPRGDLKAFAITYELQCGARRFRTRDALFTTIAGTEEPEAGIAQDWTEAGPGSVAALVLDAACFGRMDGAARRIAGPPLAEAESIFRGAVQIAAAPSVPRRLLPRDELACRLRHGESAQQVSQHPDATPAGCRVDARAAHSDAVARTVPTRGTARPAAMPASMLCEGQQVVTNADGESSTHPFHFRVAFAPGQLTITNTDGGYPMPAGRYSYDQEGDQVLIPLTGGSTARLSLGSGQFRVSWTFTYRDYNAFTIYDWVNRQGSSVSTAFCS
ncbi:MAG: hypothetical protein QOH47_998 [Sphingomonadales bacterium]|jgi:hypothetical protein|nr:hypothetical protein [Sphingomonadales bacterium]